MAWVILASAAGSVGAVFLKSGAAKLKLNIPSLLTNWNLFAGIGVYVLSSILFIKGVRQGELSVLYPMVAIGYVLTLVWSRIFFKEPFTKEKFLGVALIFAGIVLLANAATK
jgi:multidrug transporter EmrE-like cation transporter